MLKEIRKNPFIAIFTLWCITEIINRTTLDLIAGIPISYLNNLSNYLILMLLLIQIIFFQKYKLQEVYIIILITIPFVISAALTGYYLLLSSWIFIVSAKKTEFEKIVCIVYKILLIMIPMIIVLHFLGFIDDFIIFRNGVPRHSLGFDHPNTLGLRVFQLVACHCYINRKKIRAIDLIYFFLATLFVYFVPNSQTSCMCLGVLLLLLIIYRIVDKYKVVSMGFYLNCLFVLTIFFNLISLLWSFIGVEWSSVLKQIDKFISRRFSACYKVFQIYGVSVWGQHINLTAGRSPNNSLYLDNAYMALILHLGIMSYLVFTLLYLISMMYFKEKKYYVLFIIFTVYALYGVMERGLFQTTNNIFLVAISNVVFGKEILEFPIERKRKIILRA